jgi:hypothetical protein
MMKSKTFIQKATDIAKNYKTLYVMGCFGAPMTAKNKDRYTENHSYNKSASRRAMINGASEDTFGFDCVCFIKGILWGWSGDKSKVYGGASYAVNGVPDIDANAIIKKCSEVSTDFSKVIPGEIVWMTGHVGIYIGDGLVVECTPSWANDVQITAVGNMGKKDGYNSRKWTKHGKLPYVDYSDQTAKPKVTYQVYAGGKWWGEITGYNEVNSNGYAGVFGKDISGIRVKLSNGKKVTVRSHICGKAKNDWLAAITRWDGTGNGYSGWKGKPTDCIAMKADGVKLKYRVHVKGGGWLDWITDYDITDYANGLAGVYGKPIDAVQIDVV